jgi:hypothetical protein
MADDSLRKVSPAIRKWEGEQNAPTQGSMTEDVRGHMKTMSQSEFSGYDKISPEKKASNAAKLKEALRNRK